MNIGDVITIHLLNNASFPISFYPRGLVTEHGTKNTLVDPGQKQSLSFSAPEILLSKTPEMPLFYLYHSDADLVRDPYTGLIGPLIVYPPKTAWNTDSLGREFVVLFAVVDETKSRYIEENRRIYGGPKSSMSDENWKESNQMHSMNGLVFANLRGLEMNVGDKVRWYLAAVMV